MRAEGIEVVRVVINEKASGVRRIWQYLRYCIRAVVAARQSDIDVIYVHVATLSLFPLAFVSSLIRSPLVVNFHGTDVMSSHWLSRFMLRCNRKLLQRAAMIVVPSGYLERRVRARISNQNICVSPSSGIDRRSFFPGHAASEYGGRQLRLGFASRLIEHKGWRDFLAAAELIVERHPELDVSAMVAGGGPDAEELMALVSCLSSRLPVEYVGELKQNQLGEFYRQLSLFIFPSRMPESLGLVALEAMACGIPVVACSVGAVPSLIRPGFNGYLCLPGCPESLARSIENYIVLKPTAKHAMRNRCVNFVTPYSNDTVHQLLANRLRSLARQAGARPVV